MKKNPGRKKRRALARENAHAAGKERARQNEIAQKKAAAEKKKRK